MESPDVVDTSDVEEREVFAPSRHADHRIPAAVASGRADAPRPTHLPPIIRRDRSRDGEAENSSPRKRVKVAHDVGSDATASARPVIAEDSLLNEGRPDVPPVEPIPVSSSAHSPRAIDGDEGQASALLPPNSDWHLRFSSPGQPPEEHRSPVIIHKTHPQSMSSPSMPQPLLLSPSRSLSISTDHYSLFSSPLRRPETPPQTSSQGSRDQRSSVRENMYALATSPLTPASSPALPAQPLSQSPGPLQPHSPRPSQASQSPSRSSLPPAGPHPIRSPSAVIPEDPQPLGRYALRRREARQLNPYAYDKLLYKQQLKFHPDAIVKHPSPHRRRGSGQLDEDETLAFSLDNPDDDGDYVNVEPESNRRRRVRSFDRTGELEKGIESLGMRPMDEGWLPEILKELSSNDEDDNEIRKLAKKVRREREKAEAMARAESREAAAEARRAELETKRASKKRPKPFPLRGDAEHTPTHFPERAPSHVSPPMRQFFLKPTAPQELSPLPSIITRTHTEPAIASYPSTPEETPSEPPVPFRPSSYSPAFASPDFNVYLQEDSYQFDDHDAPVPWNGPSAAYSTPPSPSGPPTTSGASAFPSNTSGMESESDRGSTVEMTSKDKKRLRALKHMMPAAMIARQLGVTQTTQRPPPRAKVTTESSESEAEEVRLIPGLARVRKGKYRDVEIRGDPESSDVEYPIEVYEDGLGHGTTEILSDGESSVRVRRTRHPTPKLEDEVISISGNSKSGSSEDMESQSSDDENTHQSCFDRPAGGPARERSLIDWMLTRTRNVSKPKARSKQTSGARRSRGSVMSRPDIVTSGARRYGTHHQTLLPFTRANKGSSTASSTKHRSEHQDRIARPDRDATGGKKWKRKQKRQSGTNSGLLYNVHHDARRITSRHRESKSSRGKTLVIESDDDEIRQALDPGWKTEVDRWNKSAPLTRQPTANPAPSALPAPRPRLYRRTSRPQNEFPLPHYFQHQEDPCVSVRRRIVVDTNITPLPSGVKFSTTSYIGKGLLYQLVSITSGKSEVTPPMSCNAQGLEIDATTSAAVFSALLGPLCDRLASALRDLEFNDADTMKEWESVTRASSQLLSWLAVHAEDEEFGVLEVALREYTDGLLLVLESLETSVYALSAYWFIVELSARLTTGIKYRQGSVENGHLVQSVKQLIQRLLNVDLQPAFVTFRAAEGDVDVTSLPHRVAELWVCLMHLLPNYRIPQEATPGHPLWHLLADLHPESSTGADASEDLWQTLFSLCALSQFSVHGLSTSVFQLPAAWELVATALRMIKLTADPEKEHQLPQRAFKRRDEYISFVVSRCFLLWKQWGWRLDEGIAMFKCFQEIFRSRNFANLLGEQSAPMGFIEKGDLELLSNRDPQDAVFEVFLKLVVQAVHLINADTELDTKQRSTHIRKLLQIAVPVSPVPFSRSTPPTIHTLSMLVNRFNAMAVAAHLDPTSSNVKFRIGQAKRCVAFGDADDDSRMACVYGMMNFAMIVRHHKIVGGLEEVLRWLREMTDILMDEYKEEEAGSIRRKRTIMLIQLVIGSVRRVIEAPSLDRGQSRVEYPEPALLDGPWVTRVFNPRTDLVTIQQTGFEIRMLVQSFLDARLAAMPEARPPPPPIVRNVEGQESQDEYDKLFLDLNDEELLAALGDETEASIVADLKSKEDALCKVLDKSITPAVYRLVCRHFGEKEHAKNDATNARAADEWIDCWVGCANVLVQNNYKDWGLYMKLGEQSWEKIIDASWRRRVGLRFNLTLLRLNPGAYSKMKDDFIAVLLVAILSVKSTIEHEFISVVLSLDGLQHPLLCAAPLDPTQGTRKYEVSQVEYSLTRERLIETVLANTARCLRAKVDAESQSYVELVVMMLSTMRNIYQDSAEDKAAYGEFCQRVLRTVSDHPELVSHPRLSDAEREWNM